MRYSYLGDPSGAYPRVPISISITSVYLGWDNNLIDVCGAIVLY